MVILVNKTEFFYVYYALFRYHYGINESKILAYNITEKFCWKKKDE